MKIFLQRTSKARMPYENNIKNSNEWFSEWFNSPFYPILYKNRDWKEAEVFVSNLLTYLKPSQNDKVLDLACGRGRHSIFLSQYELDIVGMDLSKESIAVAKENEKENLRFYEGDMRNSFPEQNFDLIFNLFTSFGYFEDENDNIKVLQNIKKALKEKGSLVLDFFNPTQVIKKLIPYQTKNIQNIAFKIEKYIVSKHIEKHIYIQNEDKNYHFVEKVQLFSKNDFLKMFEKIGLKIQNIWGDYDLNTFDEKNSERMIFLIQK
jgi:SAM-dependent methyltransferase